MTNLCPCSSGLSYKSCCEPYIKGIKHALSPGLLMRSRYTAYVKQDVDYLISTWHPDCKASDWRSEIIGSFSGTAWLGLTIIEETAGNSSDEGFVEFIARFNDGDPKHKAIHERSRFLRIEQRWYYVDGTKPQPGRNAICPCGSGSKYKKCCGQ
ncbi:YchJ family protein [Serratia aquatilis]|uniref:UPF0225 protein ACFFJ3_04775 n=1 Tax=Serratia aquatilis TaxID=1737515 RepID=A0ABV6EA92_9GAMM